MYDFLLFNRLISGEVLLALYYLGALCLPYGIWRIWNHLRRLCTHRSEGPFYCALFPSLSNTTMKVRVYALLLIGLIAAETVWRMMFEVMIAYFRMHDYLRHLSGGIS